jgi:hypothetical protein
MNMAVRIMCFVEIIENGILMLNVKISLKSHLDAAVNILLVLKYNQK